MTKPNEMTNEELVIDIANICQDWKYRYNEFEPVRAELLRRLARSGEPPQPRCPKTRKEICEWTRKWFERRKVTREDFDLPSMLSDFAYQFFGPSAPQPQPPLKDRIADLLKIASGTEGWPTDDQVFDYVKALLESRRVAPSGSAGQEPEGCTCKKPDFQHAICPVHDTEAAVMMGLEPEGRAEPAAEPPFPAHIEYNLSQIKRISDVAEPVVSASPAPHYYCESLNCQWTGHSKQHERRCPKCGSRVWKEGSSTLTHKPRPDCLLCHANKQAEAERKQICKCGESLHEHGPNDICPNRQGKLAAAQPVAANPPEPSDLECQGEWCKRVHVAICGGTPSATHEEMHGCGNPISFEEMFRCADCRVPFHQHCLKKHFNEHTGLVNPKVEEIAEEIRAKVYKLWKRARGVSHSNFGQASWQGFVRDDVAAILGPLFTQVSQPPAVTPESVAQWLRKERPNLSDPERYEIYRLLMVFAVDHLAAPVTPVSALPENIMHRAFDYQPFREAAKRIEDVLSHASLDEIRYKLRNLADELKQQALAPVSGNGTEPPDDLRTALQNIIPICKYNGNRTGDGNWAKIELIAERALAGADSHNGQGWVSQLKKLRDEGWMVAVHNDYRQDGKHRTFWLFTRVGREGQFVKGEGETDADALQQITRQLASHALPAPPSEAEGPQKENKNEV